MKIINFKTTQNFWTLVLVSPILTAIIPNQDNGLVVPTKSSESHLYNRPFNYYDGGYNNQYKPYYHIKKCNKPAAKPVAPVKPINSTEELRYSPYEPNDPNKPVPYEQEDLSKIYVGKHLKRIGALGGGPNDINESSLPKPYDILTPDTMRGAVMIFNRLSITINDQNIIADARYN